MVIDIEKAKDIASRVGNNYGFLVGSVGKNFADKGVKPQLVATSEKSQVGSGKSKEPVVKEPPMRFEIPMYSIGFMNAMNAALTGQSEKTVSISENAVVNRLIANDARKARRGY